MGYHTELPKYVVCQTCVGALGMAVHPVNMSFLTGYLEISVGNDPLGVHLFGTDGRLVNRPVWFEAMSNVIILGLD